MNLKIIGLLGVSENPVSYYNLIIENLYRDKFGRYYFPKIVERMASPRKIAALMEEDKWEDITGILTEEAGHIKKCGADFLVIASNTMHFAADKIQESANIPILHIADVMAEEALHDRSPGNLLLGTMRTMNGPIKDKLIESGLNVRIPSERDQKALHEIITKELYFGGAGGASKDAITKMIFKYFRPGHSVMLGSTGLLPLLYHISSSVCDSRAVYHTPYCHAFAAARKSLER